jgi:protocatechuate 3,4-dioxygenase beta subunit
VKPALIEGPYFVDEKLNRADIRSDPSDNSVKPGAPLNITFRIAKISGSSCVALAGATIDVWHCDALGIYSDSSDPNFGSTKGKKFLRGYQTTDSNGIATFTTIYPGWYQGRAVHIHFKIRSKTSSGAAYDFTSQFFFNETLTDQVHAQAPYAAKGQGRLRNEGDGIYQGGGSQLLLNPGKTGDAYATTFDIGVQIV